MSWSSGLLHFVLMW